MKRMYYSRSQLARRSASAIKATFATCFAEQLAGRRANTEIISVARACRRTGTGPVELVYASFSRSRASDIRIAAGDVFA